MKIKFGNKTVDSRDEPVALVLSPFERRQLYVVLQDHIVNEKDKPTAYMKAPDDVPLEICSAWLAEAVTEFDVKHIHALTGGRNDRERSDDFMP